MKPLFFLFAAVLSILLLASCGGGDASIPFFSSGEAQGDASPLIALSKAARQGFAEGDAAFLFAFPVEASAFPAGGALEVAVEIAGEEGEAASASVCLMFLTEDDFERLPAEGKPRLKGLARELQDYNGRKTESGAPFELSGDRAALSECPRAVSIRMAAPADESIAGFALLVSAPESLKSSILYASRQEASSGWIFGAESGKIAWAGFPSSGGSLSCAVGPGSLPSVLVPEGHSVSVLLGAQAEDALPSGGAAALAAGQARAAFISEASGKEFGMRVPPLGGISVFQPCLLGEEAGTVVPVSGQEHIRGVFTSPAFPRGDDGVAGGSGLLSFPQLEPIAADPHGIIEWPRSEWRRPEREVFSWDRFPSVLVFDTADYDIQNRYFRRLAFFAEKQGYSGSLLTDAELEGMHAFNAHDYSAETLAEFFTLAALSDFPLLDEELELRGILLNCGIIRSSGGGGFEAGAGAVISISRASPSYLRYSFMAHEGFHALYFIDEAFREKVGEVYAATDPRATEFLRDYFRLVGGLGYDTSNALLMENEFLGYLLQNRIDSVPSYFAVNIAERYLRYGGNEALAARVMETNAADFVAAAEDLSAYAYFRWGILGGRVGLQFWDE